jgi:hypothetical protein
VKPNPSGWIAYQALLNQTLTQMAEIIEGTLQDQSWSSEDSLRSLVAIQKLHHAWLEGNLDSNAHDLLTKFSFRLPMPQGVQIRAGLESIQTWLNEVQSHR